MMASGQSSRGSSGRGKVPSGAVVKRRQGLPWLTILAVVVVLALAGGIFAVVYSKQHVKNQANDRLDAVRAEWSPTPENMDPSRKIQGIYIGQEVFGANSITLPKYKAAIHVTSDQRVDYDRYPPVGGPHDGTWAACNGVVYTVAVRDENMVHTLEHGAIWIAYNEKTISTGDLDKLKALVVGHDYISLSPYPNLVKPISLQSWGHQLMVDSADDARIEQFIVALQENQYLTPEVGGSCVPSADFNPTNPPLYDPSPRGVDAVPQNGGTLASATGEVADTNAAASGAVSGSASGSAAASSGAATSGTVSSTAAGPASSTAASSAASQ